MLRPCRAAARQRDPAGFHKLGLIIQPVSAQPPRLAQHGQTATSDYMKGAQSLSSLPSLAVCTPFVARVVSGHGKLHQQRAVGCSATETAAPTPGAGRACSSFCVRPLDCLSSTRISRPGFVSRGGIGLRSRRVNSRHSSGSWCSSSGSNNLAGPLRASFASNASNTSSGGVSSDGGNNLALFVEVDGALMDLQMDGHRVAFNKAFENFGMDCTSWTPIVYNDLLASGDGTGEGLIFAYFNTVGWPLSTATSERGIFASRVHGAKQAALAKMIAADAIPLRDGALQVLTDAAADGARIVLLGGTQSELGSDVTASAVRRLPPQLAERVTSFSISQRREEEASPDDLVGNLSAQLSAATADLKQQQLQDFITAMGLQQKGRRSDGSSAGNGEETMSINIDPNLQAAAAGGRRSLDPSTLAALAATAGVPLACCILLAANNSTLQAGAAAGMAAVIIPRRFAQAGSFPAAKAKFEGYGPGNASWARLKRILGA